jgi:hypothetical protein
MNAHTISRNYFKQHIHNKTTGQLVRLAGIYATALRDGTATTPATTAADLATVATELATRYPN